MKKYPYTMKGKTISLDEKIMIPNWDTYNLSFEQIRALSYFLDRKAKQDEMRKEHQQR